MNLTHCSLSNPVALSSGVCVYSIPFADTPILWEHLSPEEIARTERYKIAESKLQFACTRSWLRVLLGEALGCDPRAVSFRFGDNGKPFLDSEGVSFNVSHTGGLGLIALSQTSKIGIDLERKRPIPDALDMVKRFFAPAEYERFCEIDENERPNAFLRGWTRKESILKGVGHGISSLADCEVSLDDSEDVQLYCLKGDTNASEKWRILSWEPTPEHIAAIAIERTIV